MIAEGGLRHLLDAAELAGPIDPTEFASCVSITVDDLARLADVPPASVAADSTSLRLQEYVRQSLAVLREALGLNGREAVVIKWFREKLEVFGMKSPAVLVSEGKAEALIDYIRSIESGSSG